jgi:hypothetical protein
MHLNGSLSLAPPPLLSLILSRLDFTTLVPMHPIRLLLNLLRLNKRYSALPSFFYVLHMLLISTSTPTGRAAAYLAARLRREGQHPTPARVADRARGAVRVRKRPKDHKPRYGFGFRRRLERDGVDLCRGQLARLDRR